VDYCVLQLRIKALTTAIIFHGYLDSLQLPNNGYSSPNTCSNDGAYIV